MIRELIWQYPLTFAITFCVSVTAIGAIGVVACFSVKPKVDD